MTSNSKLRPPVKKMTTCLECKTRLLPEWHFCPDCGRSISHLKNILQSIKTDDAINYPTFKGGPVSDINDAYPRLRSGCCQNCVSWHYHERSNTGICSRISQRTSPKYECDKYEDAAS